MNRWVPLTRHLFGSLRQSLRVVSAGQLLRYVVQGAE